MRSIFFSFFFMIPCSSYPHLDVGYSSSSFTMTTSATPLKDLIDCFANYMPNASLRPDNSRADPALCDWVDIVYCRTDSGHDDHFCHFTGTNHLELDESATPDCYFNCQMETCNAWDVAHDEHQQECILQMSI